MGYHRAGFDVVGVDIEPQPNYPFEFVEADIVAWAPHLWMRHVDVVYEFDAIHASPPCQAFTTMNNRWGSRSPDLISVTRDLALEAGLPYAIENVPGALRALRNPVRLTGESFGLGVHRPRLFETSWLLLVPSPLRRQPDPAAVYGKNDQRRLWTRTNGSELRAATLEQVSVAMGIDWMTWDEICEAIPPAYTEFIGTQLLAYLRREQAA